MTIVYVSTSKSFEKVLLQVDLKESVENLKEKIATQFSISSDHQNLIYRGRLLADGKSLQSYNILDKSTVYVMPKNHCAMLEESTVNISEMILKLKRLMLNPKVLDKISNAFDKPEMIRQIQTAIPGLQEDTIACSILLDKDLMYMLMDPSNLDSVVRAHPALGQAALYVLTAAGVDTKEASLQDQDSMRSQFSLDQSRFEGATDDSYGLTNPEQFPIGDVSTFRPYDSNTTQNAEIRTNTSQRQLVTQHQLQTALASAFTSSSQQGGAMESPQSHRNDIADINDSSTATARQSNRITSDLLSRALNSALSNNGESNEASQHLREPLSQERRNQVQLLHDMGIQDEALCVRALEITNGDINEAVNLIFSGDL